MIQKKSLEKKLEDRKIIANFSGILADFNVAPGDYLEAKDSVGTLVERSYLKSYVEVVETDAPKLAANQIVYCTFPSYPDHTVEGYVVSYPQVGTLTSRGASIVQVEIRIDNPPQIILPNYSFTGQIQITPPQTILLAPKEAVSFSISFLSCLSDIPFGTFTVFKYVTSLINLHTGFKSNITYYIIH